MSACIQCKSGAGKLEERDNASHIFCGRACQRNFYRAKKIGLQDGTIVPPVDNDDVIGLESNDGARFRIKREQAMRAGTLQNLLEDAGAREYIPLPTVDGPTLRWIVHYMENENVPTHTDFSDDEFDRLLKAANYLDFQDLLFYLYPEWVNSRFVNRNDNELLPLARTAMYFFRGTLEFGNAHLFPPRTREFYERYFLQWPVVTAAVNGRADVMEHLLRDKCTNPTVGGSEALVLAAAKGHVAVVELLSRIPRVYPVTAFHTAVHAGSQDNGGGRDVSNYLRIVALLLKDRRVDPTVFESDALRVAVRNGGLAMVDLLLRDGRANPAVNNIILVAAEHGHAEVVKRLLQDPRVDPTILEDIDDPEMQELAAAQIKKRQRIQSRFIMAKAASHE